MFYLVICFDLNIFVLQAEAMIQQIGYPPFITNLTSLEQYFSGVSDFKLCTFFIRVHPSYIW